MDKPTAIGMRPAVFLDRDGTVIEHVHLLTQPEQVKLIPGAADAIRNLQALDYACIIVTNQSGIARGLYTVEDYEGVQRRLVELLAKQGAHIDGAYFCPHHPQFTGRCRI